MMKLMPLAEAPRRVGESVRFAAVVQQISTGKRALVAARQRVAAFSELLLADPSAQFFQLTCWGDALPTLPAADHAPQDAAIRVGDIVLFSGCVLRIFRGAAEAQFSPQSSRAQLLFRRGRYFNTRDVRLQDLYPMIEWYRQHRRELALSDSALATPVAAAGGSSATRIEDLRENMVATVVCRLSRRRNVKNAGSAPSLGLDPASAAAATSRDTTGASTELDGVLLSELVMQDGPNDSMAVNLWDQHAENRAVARLVNHRGAVRVSGIVVSLHATSSRLLANTTDQTTFQCLEPSDPDSIALDQRLTGGVSDVARTGQPPLPCATIEDLEASTCEGRHVLHNARVEQLHLDASVGSNGRVLPRFAHRLVEAVCSTCMHLLPVQERDSASVADDGERETHMRVDRCVNGCASRQPSVWRYRSLHMTLRDDRSQRVVVQVDAHAVVDLVGNIDAQTLATASTATRSARVAVARMLSALVASGDQRFDAEIRVRVAEPAASGDLDSHSHPSSIALACSGDRESQPLRSRSEYVLTALVPTTQHLLLPF